MTVIMAYGIPAVVPPKASAIRLEFCPGCGKDRYITGLSCQWCLSRAKRELHQRLQDAAEEGVGRQSSPEWYELTGPCAGSYHSTGKPTPIGCRNDANWKRDAKTS